MLHRQRSSGGAQPARFSTARSNCALCAHTSVQLALASRKAADGAPASVMSSTVTGPSSSAHASSITSLFAA